MQGKRRTIEDASGKPLFKLERNWTSKRRAWVLRSEGENILTVEYGAMHRKMTMSVSFEKSSKTQHEQVRVQASDNAGGHVSVISGGNDPCHHAVYQPEHWIPQLPDGGTSDLVNGCGWGC